MNVCRHACRVWGVPPWGLKSAWLDKPVVQQMIINHEWIPGRTLCFRPSAEFGGVPLWGLKSAWLDRMAIQAFRGSLASLWRQGRDVTREYDQVIR